MIFRILLLGVLLFSSLPAWSAPKTSSKTPDPSEAYSAEYQQTLNDVKATLGIVPTFIKGYPADGLPGAWETFKSVQLNPNTSIPNKYKDLMGVALAGQIPCHYCSFFHTEGAKGNGATDNEIKEAVALGALERHWSTFINGTQQDIKVFRREVDDFMDKLAREAKSGSGTQARVNNTSFSTPDEAYKDIKESLGVVPEFLKSFPRSGIVGAWKQMKSLSFNPKTAIPAKYKDLISLAVAAQIPCDYCVYYDTKAAKLDGATQEEINEIIALSSLSRHWSTVLNGLQINDKDFRKEMAQIWGKAKKNVTAKANTSTKTPMTTNSSITTPTLR